MPRLVLVTKDFCQTKENPFREIGNHSYQSSCNLFSLKWNGMGVPTLTWITSQRPSTGYRLESLQIELDNPFPLTKGFQVLQHGYQSWSLTTRYNATDTDISPKLEFLRYSQENLYSHHKGIPGNFLSEGFLLLYSPQEDTGCILYATEVGNFGTKFEVQLSVEGAIQSITLHYDIHCLPELRGHSPIHFPGIEKKKFKGSPEKALALYYQDFGKANPPPNLPRKTPTGCCSWYYYYTSISEKTILDNLRAVRSLNLDIEFFQVDDGYQKEIGDWITPNEKFPGGMKLLAQEIQREGLRPGIWLAPFLARKKSQFFQKYPEAILKDEKGRPVPALWNPLWGWNYTYCLDVTHPASIEFLKKVFKTIVENWGYTYLKLDFLYSACLDGVFYDNSQSPQQRYRNILQQIRSWVGKDVFLLGCGAPMIGSVGIFEGMRIGCDVSLGWGPDKIRRWLKDKNAFCTEKALINSITRSSMHRKLWLNDPDCLLVRKNRNFMTLPQTILMATVMSLTGGMLLVSDDLTQLQPERLQILQKSLEISKLCQGKTPMPIGLFSEEFPRGLYNPAGFLGIWNPTEIESEITLKLPIPLKSQNLKDVWTGNPVGAILDEAGKTIHVTLPAFGSVILETGKRG